MKHSSAMLRPLRLALGLTVAGAALLGCHGRSEEPAPAAPEAAAPGLPEGTVLTVGGVPITAEEVDRYVELVSLMEPQFVEDDHRRKALTNILIPMAAAQAVLPEEREAAFQRLQAIHLHMRETGKPPPDAPKPRYVSGTVLDLGMVEWEAARQVGAGNLSAMVETPGGWTFVKVLATNNTPGEPFDGLTQVTAQIYEVPFLDGPGMRDIIQGAIDALPIEVVDPAWEPLVPPLYLYGPRPAAAVPDRDR